MTHTFAFLCCPQPWDCPVGGVWTSHKCAISQMVQAVSARKYALFFWQYGPDFLNTECVVCPSFLWKTPLGNNCKFLQNAYSDNIEKTTALQENDWWSVVSTRILRPCWNAFIWSQGHSFNLNCLLQTEVHCSCYSEVGFFWQYPFVGNSI